MYPIILSLIFSAYPLEYTIEVSNLPSRSKDVKIIDAFNKYGNITYIQRIAKNKAVVGFLRPEEARSAALRADNVAKIGDRVLKVKLRPGKVENKDKDAERIIFVYPAYSSITEDNILKNFKKCGKIIYINRKLDKFFVLEFADTSGSQAALKLHNSILKDTTISVKLKNKNRVPWYPWRTIVLLNNNNLTAVEFVAKLKGSDIFEKYGKIENCDIICDKGRLAMITFETEDSAVKALELNGKEVNGMPIAVELYATELQRHALPQKVDSYLEKLDLARGRRKKVYIRSFSSDACEEDLKQLFSLCGPVEKVSILPERGAIVEFSDSDGYCQAFKFHEIYFMNKQLYLLPFSEYKFARKRVASGEESNIQPKKLKKDK